MAESITIKALQDASLDAKSLEEVVNGNESKQVTTRKGESYPSVKKAIKTMFENGGLPATPFATKALMTASALVDGQYAMVTDDTPDNFGLYIKEGGVWRKTKFYSGYADEVKEYLDLRMVGNLAAIEASKKALLNKIDSDKSEAELKGFYGDYRDGVLIDAAQESDSQVLVVANGVDSYSSIDDYFAGAFLVPKMVVNKDGDYEWSGHNAFIRTDSLTATSWTKTGVTVKDGLQSATGHNTAFEVVTTATTNFIRQAPHPFPNARNATVSMVIKPLGNTTHCCLSIDTLDVIFNLMTKVVISKGSAFNAEVVDLGNGYLRVSASAFFGARANVGFSISDTPNKVASSVGLVALVEQLQCNLGGTPLAYCENKGATHRVLPTFDYSNGERCLMVEPTRTYVGAKSEDLTDVVWVKSGISVALTARSPDNSPCSRITATSANGTVLQTLQYTAYIFSALVKRVSGSGAVLMTTDGGVTWDDITNKISDKYSRVSVSGNAGVIGFKLNSIGDVIDVCYANGSRDVGVPSPMQFEGEAGALGGDSLNPIALNGEVTTYIKMHIGENPNNLQSYQPFKLTGVAPDGFSPYLAPVTAPVKAYISDVNGSDSITIAASDYWETAEITAIASKITGRYEVSVNNEFTIGMPEKHNPMITGMALAVPKSSVMYYNKILIVREAVDLEDIRNWRYTPNQSSVGVVNSTIVTLDSSIAGTSLMREPTLCILHDDGNEVDILYMHMNKREVGYNDEAPARLMQRKIRYNKTTNEFTFLTETEVMYEYPEWSLSEGHTQSAGVTRITNGVNKGRLVCLFAKAEGATPAIRNVYRMFNDNDGDALSWTTPEKVIDGQEVYGYNAVVTTPDGSSVVLPPNHPTHPNRILTLTNGFGGFACIWSDDDGVTWDSSLPINNADNAGEASICYLPNGNLLVSSRMTSVDVRSNFVSADGGVTWTDIGNMINSTAATVSGSIVQLDPTGRNTMTNPNGDVRLIVAGLAGGRTRAGIKVDKVASDLLTITGSIPMINGSRSVGYSASKPILGGKYIATAFESGSTVSNFNKDSSAYLMITRL